MSGVQTFVDRIGRHSAPAGGGQGQPVRDDRAAAQKLKFGTREINKRTFAPSRSSTSTPDTQYSPHSYQTATLQVVGAPRVLPLRERLEDSTVDSDFEQTISEAHFNQRLNAVESIQGDQELFSEGDGSEDDDLEQPEALDPAEHLEEFPGRYNGGDTREYRQEEYETEPEQAIPPYPLRRTGGSPTAHRQKPASRQSAQNSGISGRFAKNINLPVRQGQQEHTQDEQSRQKKRPYTPEPQQTNRRHEQVRHSQQPNPALSTSSNSISHEGEDEHVSKTASPDGTPRRAPNPRSSQHMPSEPNIPEGVKTKKPRIPLDHDVEKLKTMTYAELYTESWETGNDQTPDNRPLPERLQEIMDQTTTTQENLPTLELFTKMSTAEWEESGEWFVDSFTEIMQAMSAKRKQRRVVTAKYEKELMEREKAVRGKSDALDKKFRDMRASGEDLLKGKF